MLWMSLGHPPGIFGLAQVSSDGWIKGFCTTPVQRGGGSSGDLNPARKVEIILR